MGRERRDGYIDVCMGRYIVMSMSEVFILMDSIKGMKTSGMCSRLRSRTQVLGSILVTL